jgi:hypothetical protein
MNGPTAIALMFLLLAFCTAIHRFATMIHDRLLASLSYALVLAPAAAAAGLAWSFYAWAIAPLID